MQLIDEFKMRYPLFKETDNELVGFFMDDAAAEISEARWGKLYTRGLFALTAHLLKMATETVESGGAAAKNIAAETAGSLSVSYVAPASTDDGSNYHLTAYGQEFLRLRKLVGVGFLVV